MALTFHKKASAQTQPEPETHKQAATSAAQPGTTPAVVKKSGGIIFLKRGAAAKQAVQVEDAKAEARRAEYGRLRRFYIGYNEDSQITFLDGKLDEDGVLDCPRFMEHKIRIGTDWKNFACTAEIDTSGPCPICEAGDKASLVGVFTVIDHSTYTVKTGPNAGKTFTNQRKLFVAKEGTIKQLTKLAVKPERNGLAGCTFDVSRGSENKHPPAVGDTFDFVTKHKTLAAIAEKYNLKLEECQPAVYDGPEGELVYLPAAKLIELGIGKAHVGVGYEKGVNAAADEL